MEKFEPGIFYHIYNRANGDEKLFREAKNYRYFLRQYAKYITPVAETYAWCLLPNHFHGLIRVKTLEEARLTFAKLETLQKLQRRASRQFASLFSSYAQAFNKMYQRKGSLFMRNMKRKTITSEEYLTKTVCYIHHNPVHHGLVKKMETWPWSSFPAFGSRQPPGLPVPYETVLGWFDGQDNFMYCHQESMEQKLRNRLAEDMNDMD